MTEEKLILGDCLEEMAKLPATSVDLILCDLPYGTTQCAFDSLIPFDGLWTNWWRLLRPGCAIVLTAAQPFTSALTMSQVNNFKYGLVWNKVLPRGHLNAKKQPMRLHEDVLIFGKGAVRYFPQKTQGHITPDRKVRAVVAHPVNSGYVLHIYSASQLEVVNASAPTR